jgi:hypothetical protein
LSDAQLERLQTASVDRCRIERTSGRGNLAGK